MIFALLNTVKYPCPRTHRLHLEKFACGFIQNGYRFIEITNEESLLHLREDDVLYVSNHYSVEIIHSFIKKYLENSLHQLLSKTKCKLIFWSFHTSFDIYRWKEFSSRSIHIGEEMYQSFVDNSSVLSSFASEYDVHRITYSSVKIQECSQPIITYDREFDFHFIGSNYQENLLKYCKLKYSTNIKITPPIVDEVYRINSYNNSLINLVFHSKGNIAKGTIVERFPEALANGGIIIYDHPEIKNRFPNAKSLFFVDSVKDIDEVYNQIIYKSKDEIYQLRLESYNLWVNSDMSYKIQAKKIISKLKGGVE